MNDRLLELMDRWHAGTLAVDELHELTELLATAENRAALRSDWFLEAALPEALQTVGVGFRSAKVSERAAPQIVAESQSDSATERASVVRKSTLDRRSVVAASVGLFVGLLGTSLAWAMAMPRAVATATQEIALLDDRLDQELGRIATGFPTRYGRWSGDEAEIVRLESATGHHNAVRFVRAAADGPQAKQPSSCDVYQIIDWAPFRDPNASDDAVLELTADMRSEQTSNANSLRVAARLFAFSGTVDDVRADWPQNVRDALATGAMHRPVRTQAGPTEWQTLSTKIVVPTQADFVIVQLVVSNLESSDQPASFGEQYARNVKLKLTLKR